MGWRGLMFIRAETVQTWKVRQLWEQKKRATDERMGLERSVDEERLGLVLLEQLLIRLGLIPGAFLRGMRGVRRMDVRG